VLVSEPPFSAPFSSNSIYLFFFIVDLLRGIFAYCDLFIYFQYHEFIICFIIVMNIYHYLVELEFMLTAKTPPLLFGSNFFGLLHITYRI